MWELKQVPPGTMVEVARARAAELETVARRSRLVAEATAARVRDRAARRQERLSRLRALEAILSCVAERERACVARRLARAYRDLVARGDPAESAAAGAWAAVGCR